MLTTSSWFCLLSVGRHCFQNRFHLKSTTGLKVNVPAEPVTLHEDARNFTKKNLPDVTHESFKKVTSACFRTNKLTCAKNFYQNKVFYPPFNKQVICQHVESNSRFILLKSFRRKKKTKNVQTFQIKSSWKKREKQRIPSDGSVTIQSRRFRSRPETKHQWKNDDN